MYHTSSGFILYRKINIFDDGNDTTYAITNGISSGQIVGSLFGVKQDKGHVYINLGNYNQAKVTLEALINFKTTYHGTLFINLNNPGNDYATCTIKEKKNVQLYDPDCFTLVDDSKIVDNRSEICKWVLKEILNTIIEERYSPIQNIDNKAGKAQRNRSKTQ